MDAWMLLRRKQTRREVKISPLIVLSVTGKLQFWRSREVVFLFVYDTEAWFNSSKLFCPVVVLFRR